MVDWLITVLPTGIRWIGSRCGYGSRFSGTASSWLMWMWQCWVTWHTSSTCQLTLQLSQIMAKFGTGGLNTFLFQWLLFVMTAFAACPIKAKFGTGEKNTIIHQLLLLLMTAFVPLKVVLLANSPHSEVLLQSECSDWSPIASFYILNDPTLSVLVKRSYCTLWL